MIYAQPVHLKPVGRPIPAIPIKGPGPGAGYGGPGAGYGQGAGYGPPKPIPFPSSAGYGNGGGPPPLTPYKPHKPNGYRPPPPPAPIYEPERYDGYRPSIPSVHDKKPEVVVNAHHGVQQHVHHHFHHADNNDKSPYDLPNGVGVVGSGGGIPPSGYAGDTNSLYSNGFGPSYGGGLESYASSPQIYKKEFNIKKQPIGEFYFLLHNVPTQDFGFSRYRIHGS